MKLKQENHFIKMNNKGQSLVAFILLLPVILLFMTSLWEIGDASVTKAKYENEIKSTIKYGLNHLEEENIREKIENLIFDLKGPKIITIEENKIAIKYEYSYQIFNNKKQIKISYIGYKENDKIIIEKEG